MLLLDKYIILHYIALDNTLEAMTVKNILRYGSCQIRNFKKFTGSDSQNLYARLGVAIVISSVTWLTACEQQTGETIASPQSNPQLSSAIKIDLDSPAEDNDDNNKLKALPIACRNSVIMQAFDKKQSEVQVKGCGKVVAILADDNEGSRHQRFIVELEGVQPKHTVLIAHNIDLAPKVDGLKKADDVIFYGQYEYNQQGGVVHWTHHDPAARHQNGWIEYKGHRFQ